MAIKRPVVLAGWVLAGLVALGAVFSWGGHKPAPLLTVSGKVKQVTMQAGQAPAVVLKTSDGRQLTLVANVKQTVVTRGHKLASISQIRSDDLVQAEYTIRHGQNLARTITVTPPPAAKPAAKPAPKPSSQPAKKR
ncbi:MAG: hypothetical protein HY597_05660 [Candidatus Omnitrophica bacterium]|nr:hypothetical protein [Candidatus Omnitrophota bacterium]